MPLQRRACRIMFYIIYVKLVYEFMFVCILLFIQVSNLDPLMGFYLNKFQVLCRAEFVVLITVTVILHHPKITLIIEVLKSHIKVFLQILLNHRRLRIIDIIRGPNLRNWLIILNLSLSNGAK